MRELDGLLPGGAAGHHDHADTGLVDVHGVDVAGRHGHDDLVDLAREHVDAALEQAPPGQPPQRLGLTQPRPAGPRAGAEPGARAGGRDEGGDGDRHDQHCLTRAAPKGPRRGTGGVLGSSRSKGEA